MTSNTGVAVRGKVRVFRLGALGWSLGRVL